MKAEEILEKHCPSMNNLYLDEQGKAFRDRIILAMEEYAKRAVEEYQEFLMTEKQCEKLLDE